HLPCHRDRFGKRGADASLGGAGDPMAAADVSHPRRPQPSSRRAGAGLGVGQALGAAAAVAESRRAAASSQRSESGPPDDPADGQFIRRWLAPGGTLFLVECGLKWPTTGLGDRHVFQFGALGGAEPQEYHEGGERVAEYLARYRSHRRRWEPPAPDAQRPE